MFRQRNRHSNTSGPIGMRLVAWLRRWGNRLDIGLDAQKKRREMFKKLCYRRTQKQVARFRQISSLSESQKKVLWKTIVAIEYRESAFLFRSIAVLRRVGIILAYFTILLAAILLAWDWSTVAMEFSSIDYPALIPIYFGLLATVFWLAGGIPYRQIVVDVSNFDSMEPDAMNRFFLRLFRRTLVILVAYLVIAILLRMGLPWQDYQDTRFLNLAVTIISAISSALKLVYFSYCYLFFIAVFLALGLLASHRRYEAKNSENVIISKLSELLYTIEGEPTQWQQDDFKKGLMMKLESLASCTEHYLPRSLSSGDAMTDAWMKGQTGKIAQTFRTWKQWILTPMADTREFLLGCISSALVSITTGDWDAIEKTPIDYAARERLWHVRLLSLGKSLLIGCVISAFAVVIRHLPGIRISDGWIYLGPAYVLLMLAYALAPELVSSIAIFKSVKELVSPDKK